MTVFIVLAYHGDGSLMGAETVVAVFDTLAKAERFVQLMEIVGASKELAIAERIVE